MATKFITNNETFLSNTVKNLINQSKALDFLVGFFFFSGFGQIYKEVEDIPLRILVGMDADVDVSNRIREYLTYFSEDQISVFIEKSDIIQSAQFADKSVVELIAATSGKKLKEPYLIDYLFSYNYSIVSKIEEDKESLIEFAECENACATSDFYTVKELIEENPCDF